MKFADIFCQTGRVCVSDASHIVSITYTDLAVCHVDIQDTVRGALHVYDKKLVLLLFNVEPIIKDWVW